MCSTGATGICVHSIGVAVLREGCCFPVSVGKGVAIAVFPFSRHLSPFPVPLWVVPLRPLTRAWARAELGGLRRSGWSWGRAFGLLDAWVFLWPESPVCEVSCGFLLSVMGDNFRGRCSVSKSGHLVYRQVVLWGGLSGEGWEEACICGA